MSESPISQSNSSNSQSGTQSQSKDTQLQRIIEAAFDQKELDQSSPNKEIKAALEEVLSGLESGRYRVAEPTSAVANTTAPSSSVSTSPVPASPWTVNTWIKKAVLLYFRLHPSTVIDAGFTKFYDKVPLRFDHNFQDSEFVSLKTRIVPPAAVRRGAYLGAGTIIMPSFINIGSFVDAGTMVDTWATVGSCAQIGKNVHLSGGVGIGGVLEPLQASPTIIEDNCFIGARSEIVEGVIVERGSVISMGVFIGQSTRIYNRETGEIIYGRVPAGSVVVPGSLPSEDGKYSLNCAVIVKQVDEKTRSKTSLNELLRV